MLHADERAVQASLHIRDPWSLCSNYHHFWLWVLVAMTLLLVGKGVMILKEFLLLGMVAMVILVLLELDELYSSIIKAYTTFPLRFRRWARSTSSSARHILHQQLPWVIFVYHSTRKFITGNHVLLIVGVSPLAAFLTRYLARNTIPNFVETLTTGTRYLLFSDATWWDILKQCFWIVFSDRVARLLFTGIVVSWPVRSLLGCVWLVIFLIDQAIAMALRLRERRRFKSLRNETWNSR